MSEILKIVLSLSLSGALLILVLCFCKPLFRDRISKRWQYYIWLVVIARLLLPFTPDTSLVGALFQDADRGIVRMEILHSSEQRAIADAPQSGSDTTGGDFVPQDEEPLKAPIPQAIVGYILQNLWLIWLVVALILLIRKITIYQGFVRYIKAGRAEVSDTAILDRLALIGERAGVKTPVELYTNRLISSPLLLGFFRPCIVLPTADLPDADFEYIILHELTHYKRRDMFYKWLVQLTVCLHWFNPLAYLMGREIGRACELACDEAVICKLDAEKQRAYGDTLLNAIVTGGDYRDSLASMTLNESKELLKERLGAIMKFKNPSKVIQISTVFLTIAIIFGATFTGAYAAIPSQAVLPDNTTAAQANATTFLQTDSIILQENVSPSNVLIYAENCNVIILKSTDNLFKYDCDQSLYEVTTQSQGNLLTISANPMSGTIDNTEFMEDTRIRIYIPDVAYESVEIVSKRAGISVLPLNTNLDATNNGGAMSVYLNKDFNKTLKFTVNGGSGALRLQDGITNYRLNAMVTKSAFKPAEGMPQYDSGILPYTFTSGNGTSTIHLSVEDSPFKMETYAGDAVELLKTNFDLVFLPGNRKAVTSSKQKVEGANGIGTDNTYAEYEKFGLAYNTENGRFYYDGKLVRYFEDIYQGDYAPNKRMTIAGYTDGEIDVHTVSDENGVITDVEVYNQAGFDENTKNLADPLAQFGGDLTDIGTSRTDSKADTKALDIMQRTGNWGYIEAYLPEMTNAGIDAVVNSYNSKHPNSNEHKKASNYYN